MSNLGRRWLPVVAIVAVPLAAQKLLFDPRYDVSGHAAEHLSSATAPFAGFAAVAVILFLTPGARRRPVVLATAAAWMGSTVLVLVGNLRVVDALVGAGMSDVPTSSLVQTPTIESAHGLANLAPWLGVSAAIAFAVALWVHGLVTRRVAIASVALSALFPPWIIPGAGVVVLTLSRCIAADREASRVTSIRGALVDPMRRAGGPIAPVETAQRIHLNALGGSTCIETSDVGGR